MTLQKNTTTIISTIAAGVKRLAAEGFNQIKTARLVAGALMLLVCLFAAAQTAQAQAPTLVVTKTADTNDGMCNADCSLREAIDAADGNGQPDVISFNIPAGAPGCNEIFCEIDFTGGEIVPAADNGNVTTINGSGATIITLDGQNATRHFRIGANVRLAMNNLTLTRGNGFGGASTEGFGGSILISGAGSQLTLNNVRLDANSANQGGAIDANSAGAALIITNSTISNNSAANSSGGINVGFGSAATMTNVTISGNQAGNAGGIGVFFGSTLNATSLTVTNNSTTGGDAGGIFNIDGTVNIRNSIVAGNSDEFNGSSVPSPDVNGTFVSGGYNFIGVNDTAAFSFPAGNPNANNDIVGTSAAPQDPQLFFLGSSGGVTETHAPRPTSPIIDKGKSFDVTTDQRGLSRPVDIIPVPNVAGGDGSDIGAHEARDFEFRLSELQVSMTVAPNPVAPGGALTYQITVSNIGGLGAENFMLTQSDSFRQRGGAKLTVESISAPPGFDCRTSNPALGDPANTDVVCRGFLRPGETAQFTIVKRQRTPIAPGVIIYHEAQVSANEEYNPLDNRATDTTTVR